MNAGGTAPLAPVTLRNTSELRFDYSTGLLATNRLEGYGGQGRWDDDTAVVLNNSTVRLLGNRDIEVTETIGDVTVGKFGQFAVQRDLLNRTVNLVVGGGAGADITRQTQTNNGLAIAGNVGTLQINPANGSQLGSDERIKLFSGIGANGLVALGGVTNGMVAPWIINGGEAQFLTYTADNGFVNAGFDAIRTGGFGATAVVSPTERTYVNAATSFNGGIAGGIGLDTYALRMDANIGFANNTTAVATDRIRVGSGGLLGVNNNTTLVPGIDVGPVAKELNFYQNTGNFFLGALATQAASGSQPGQSSTTTGQITNATHVIKQGGGTLVIDAAQASFNGNYIVNQGAIIFRSATVQANLGTNTGTTTLAQMNAGTGGLVVINNHGGTFGVRSDVANTVYNLGMVIGEGNPLAIINNDRAAGTANVLSILTGGIRFGGSPGEQGQTLFVSNAANNVSIQVNGPLVLSAATMEGAPAYNHIRQDPNLTVYGQVSGGATLLHSGGGTLELGNGFTGFANGINTFTGGIQNIQGTVNVRGTTTGTPANFATLFSGINNGGIGSGDITMYSGTLNLLIDGANTTTRERYVVGNNATGNNLIINGSSTVTANRNIAGTAANKHLAFKDMTIGSSTLTTAIGNGYVLEINGATNLTGTPLLNIGGATLLNGAINDGAGSTPGIIGQAIIKGGGADLWLNGTTSSFGGLYAGSTSANGLGIVVNGGLLRFGDVNSENGTAMNLDTMLRGSTVRINPTGNMYLTNPANINFGTGQLQALGSGVQLPVLRFANSALNQAYLQNALSADSEAVIGLDANNANNFDLATIGNGKSYLAATAGARTYTATALGVGAGNIYRIGGGGQTLTLDSPAAGFAGVLVEGTTPGTRVLVGGQLGNTNGDIDSQDLFTYTGGTIISRSSRMVIRQASTTTAGPLGLGGAVDIFGTLQVYDNGNFRNVAGTANAYSVNLHPGSVLWLDNDAINVTNRWDNATAINLNGGQLYLRSRNDAAVTSTETVGAVNYSRGSSIRLDKRIAAGAVELTTGAFTRAGVGSTLLLVPSTAANLGVAGNDNAERLIVTGGATAITPSGVVNGMLPGYIVNGTDNTFVTYGANGVGNVTYDNTFAGGVFSTNTTGTSKVDITTAAMVLAQDQTVYALRTNQNISSGVGQYNTLTFADGATDADRGGLITTGTPTIATNLRFGTTGTKEGIIYNTGNTTLSGDIYAGSITKFGAGALIIGKDQTAAANGTGFSGNWTVNGGALTLNTLGASGDGGTITLNASGTVTGAGTTLNLLAQPGSSLEGQYTMGRIIGVDNAVIVSTTAITDVTIGIGDLEVHSTDTTGLSPARLRVNPTNTRGVISAGTLFLTGTGNSILDVAGAVNNQITSGATGAGLIVTGLNGSRDLIKWGNANLWVGGDNSTSFTGDVYIEQGAIGVTNANAFANAGTSITARRYGILDILTTGFTKAVTYEAGSIERWSVDNARSGTINLGAGSLQVNADQLTTTATIQMNGGSIEGFLRTDDVSSANNGLVFRTLGSGVSISLLGNSFLGQNAFTDGPNGTDNGRTQDLTTGVGPDTNNNGELVAAARGAILEIKGNISGVGGLTKQSSDTVILSGTNTYGGATNVANGTLRLGSATALPTGNNVTTSARGVLDLGGFNTSIGNLNSAAIAQPTTGTVFASNGGFITNSSTVTGTLTVNPTALSSYSGVIQNNLNLVKAGGETLVLRNANTYIGETTVSGGVLTLTHVLGTAGSGVMGGISGTSRLTVAGGATFNLNSGLAGSTLTLAGTSGTVLNLQNGSRLGVEVGTNAAPNTGSSIVLKTGAVALVNGTITVDAYFLPGVSTSGVSDILRAPSGGLLNTNGSTASYTVGNLYNVTNFTVSGITASDTLVQFNVVAAAALTDAYWKGGFAGSPNVWAVSNGSTLGNWATDLAGTDTGLVPSATTNVFLSATATSNQNNMVLGANMSINSLTLNATSGTPVVLQSTGDYTLTIGGAAAITSDATSGVATFNNRIALTNATPTIAVNSANTLTLAGPVSGAATSLTKTGTGTLVLSGANTYTGLTTVSAGVLSAANDLALGTTANNTTVANNGSLELQGNITIAFETLNLTGDGATVGADTSGGALRNLSGNNLVTGAVTLAAATTVQSDAGTLNINGGISGAFPLTVEGAGNTTINGIVGTGAGTIIKNDTGTLTLANANTYTGATTINAGTVTVTNALGLGTVAGGTTVNSGATLNLNGVTVAETNLSLNTGSLTSTGTSTASSAIALTGSNTIGTATATDNLTLSGVVSGAGGLTKTGAGTATLTGANTYLGETNVSAGTLILSGAGSVSDASSVNLSGATGVFNVAAIAASGETVGSLAGVAGSSAVLGAKNLNVGSNNASTTMAGTISGDGGSVTKQGLGTMILSGTNTYTGATTISAGVLQASSNGALGTTAGGTTVAAGATLELSGNVTITGEALTLNGNGVGSNGALRNVSGDNLFAGPITLAGNTRIQSDVDTLTLDVASGNAITGAGNSVTFAGGGNVVVADAISLGAGSLTKEGLGSLTLGTGTTSTVTSTTVNDGDLIVMGTLNSSGGITISSNVVSTTVATLSGTGTVNGPVTLTGDTANISTGATSAQGSIGTLNFNGQDVTFGNDTTWFVDLVENTNGLADRINNIGTLSIGSNTTLSLLPDGMNQNAGYTYTIANYSSRVGTFSNFSDGAIISGYQINYGTNAITLTAVPEPGTLGLLGLALGGFFFRRIRRRRAEVVMVDSEKSES